ncbi:hypothetical protein INT47_009583 [Mucor saturninus]|uniref:Uncharacterized protein n=1 Tax=Mucor saturninus TaxID=64648 RepID=A0A8H7QIY4_9FUNG|nr:hypothetical protein INT47_009583 [Mucor saturninus]
MSDNSSSISLNVLYLPPRVDKRTPEERARDKVAVPKSAPEQTKFPDCPVTFSNKANLYKHLAKQHRTQVETIKGRCYKGVHHNSNLRYYEKKKIEKMLANQDSDSMTATQLRSQRYYRQKMLNKAATITRAHILDTPFVDFFHLVFPSNIKKDYDAKRVVPMLVGIDVENMPETLAVGESNEKHKDKL